MTSAFSIEEAKSSPHGVVVGVFSLVRLVGVGAGPTVPLLARSGGVT
jgi:hypothetical protein